MFGNLRMIVGAAVLTMFGIGAEIGIAGVLAYGLSEAGRLALGHARGHRAGGPAHHHLRGNRDTRHRRPEARVLDQRNFRHLLHPLTTADPDVQADARACPASCGTTWLPVRQSVDGRVHSV